MKSILVVDDMGVFREPIASALRLAGYQVSCAKDGLDALGQIRGSRPDLVLLDAAMPRLDGLGLLEELRRVEHLLELPVILLTAVSERDYILRAAKLGVRDYLLKSKFSLNELLERVSKYFEPGNSEDSLEAETPSPNSAPAVVLHSDGRSAEVIHAPSDSSNAAVPAVLSQNPVATLKELKPIIRRSEIAELLEDCGELQAMSPSASHILSLTSNSSCTIQQVTRAIQQDHAIALKILKMANSSIYSRGEPVETIQKAVGRIGMSQIRQTVLNLSVVERFSSNTDDGISVPLFWEHSIATGLIAATLTRERGESDVAIDAAFTMGLVHDIGRMVYCELLGDRYGQVLEKADSLQLPLEQVESRMLLVNHADAMDRVLHAWRFPKKLIDPIAFHHLSIDNIRRMTKRSVPEVATLALSNRLSHAMLLGSSGNDTLYPIAPFVDALNLGKEVINTVLDDVPSQTEDIKLALMSHAPSDEWPNLKENLLKSLDCAIQPLVISDREEIDAYAIFFKQLASDDGNMEPNLAVVHITHKRELDRIKESLSRAENECGVSALPLLMIVKDEKLTLDSSVLNGRPVQMIRSPVTLGRLIVTVNHLLAVQTEACSMQS